MTPATDFKELASQAKFYESYSRYSDVLDRYETWDESVDRVMNMHRDYYSDKMTPELSNEIEKATLAYKKKEVLGAQRALQFGGEQLLKHQMRLYNCTFSYADRAEFFGEVFYILLCGAGSGFSVQYRHVNKLPKVQARTKMPKTHVVEDSIEGWATAADVLLSSYFVDGGKHPEYQGRRVYFDLSNIRPKGALISGGFKAPGPDPLRRALDRIEYLIQGRILNAKGQVQLRPIDVYDIVMFEADAVLAGGVRRSATICLFSPNDQEMINAKTGNWFNTNPQRGRSNNSAVINRNTITREEFANIMKSVKEFGEPGFFFVEDEDIGTNPCVEIGMWAQIDGISGWQGCNLTETNGGKCDTPEDLFRMVEAAAILGTLQAGYTDLKFVSEHTKRIFEREALLGVSITGWMNNPDVLFNKDNLKKAAQIVKATNKKIAKMIGINPAARTTCVKPSGNASVLLKTASGIHAEHSPRYFRNVQMNKEQEVATLIKESNPYMVEDGVWSEAKSDYCISFPVTSKKGSQYLSENLGVKQLDKVKLVQEYWVNEGTNVDLCVNKNVRHNVSNTITVKHDMWDDVENYVYENRKFFAGISFLSSFGDKDFDQAPFTQVLTGEEIISTYGTGALFASGLIVDGLKVFNNNLWNACSTANGYGEELTNDDQDTFYKKDWIRRYEKFADNYFAGDKKSAEYCLKDVYLLHKWEKITQNDTKISWLDGLKEKKFTEIDTMGAAACVGTTEGCVI